MQRIFEREVVSLLIISMLCSAAHYTFLSINTVSIVLNW